ncbi:hypothetical protein S7711_05266 [Stachybotrys chartarum IBT 7711]|uniref:Zinc finger PHD-type domain-containing protein n=1 Tax=Stachybotrys chartarum (strain CBS 109288 / IBT 7711) TaxID=1280523 RepID=A0A084AGL9_STACB|nr:hypothetical protein S7711_05266 [Stachybotrys chartarum IBT 7711]KFA50530.1 hypothetical protein S40293_03019 [Stachybotrys chartarum IBT 40293]
MALRQAHHHNRQNIPSTLTQLGPDSGPDHSHSAMTQKNHLQRKAPFLHRNWIAGVNGWQTSNMGNKCSSVASHPLSDDDDDDDMAPPQKRRRISTPSPADLDQLIASPRASDSRPTMRIDVSRIFHQDTKKIKLYNRSAPQDDDVKTKANCRITISDLTTSPPRVLHCQSQLCDITTSQNPFGPHRIARVHLPAPFFVPEESICVNRVDNDMFDFADAYALNIELEAAGSGQWPPLEMQDLGISSSTPRNPGSTRQWVLSCQFNSIFGKVKSRMNVTSGRSPQRETQPTQYLMDVDVRHTSGFQALKRLETGSKACITAVDPDAPPYATTQFEPGLINDTHAIDHETRAVSVPSGIVELNGEVNGINGTHDIDGADDVTVVNGIHDLSGSNGLSSADSTNSAHNVNGLHELKAVNGINGINGHLHDEAVHDHDEELEGDQTPSRALRAREKNKVYNLKVLSDQARGREKKRRAKDAPIVEIEGKITYLLPANQPVCLDYFRCVTCGVYHQTMQQLQLHLQTVHPSYDYSLETTSQGPQFRVSGRAEPWSTTPTRTHNLGPAVQPFNLHTLLLGDNSWIATRLSSDHHDEAPQSPRPKSLLDKFKSASPAPRPSKPPQQRRPERAPIKEVLVPDANQPLFHPISKARLVPGEKVPQIAPDNTWLIQKHRESIDEFSDVTPAEKEFVKEWDGFILKQSITSPAFFPRAWLAFVQEKASWLVSADRRMTEFGKHFSVLLVRNVLDDKVIAEAFSSINEARANKETRSGQPGADAVAADADRDFLQSQSPRSSQIRKSKGGCGVCHLPVMGPRLLICSNKKCSHRLYHTDCVGEKAVAPVDRRKWLCSECIGKPQPS